jgi:hypothetical protein
MSTPQKGPKDTLTVVVSGKPIEVKANENQEISVIIGQALREAGQTGRPDGDWELRAGEDQGAQVLEPTKKLRDYGLNLSSTVWLGLGSGGGG